MSVRFGCPIDQCECHYAHKKSLRAHQRKHHQDKYDVIGIQIKMLGPTKKQKINNIKIRDLVVPIVGQHERHEEQHNKNEELLIKQSMMIETLQKQVISLEEQISMLVPMAAQHASEAAAKTIDGRCSELFAHILDLKEQIGLVAKKTTKWCVVCFSQENTHAFMPCRHKCVCKDCAKIVFDRFKTCPICRRDITSAQHIYDLSALNL